MARPPKRKLSKKEQKAADKMPDFGKDKFSINYQKEVKTETTKKKIKLPSIVSVKDFAEIAGLPVTKIITELMKSGVLATINETIDFDTASIIGDDLGLEISLAEEAEEKHKTVEEKVDKKNLELRPPVVTIMGHVDHGKTTLLDNIRKAHVAEGESGGITQHITAYQVTLEDTKNKNLKNRTITFIDTPGHAAFAAMREHGTAITDMVVLIVAATDGVMPQTAEVIEDSKVNNVPIIVAINKVDVPDADIMKTKQQLSEYELIPEEWGGKTVMVEISAKTGQGVDDLLEMILLQADLMELKADPKDEATGIVIESHMQKGAGAMALVLIENGTLKKGDPVAIGSSYGRIRILKDTLNKPIEKAGPSFPVNIAGLKSLPNFGDRLLAFRNEKMAKETAEKFRKSDVKIKVATAKRYGMEEEGEKEQKHYDFNIILKSDVHGSLEAIKKLLGEVDTQEASIKIISEGVGSISESDVTLAKATHACVIGFRVKRLDAAKKIAEKEKVSIQTFDIIYELIDKIKKDIAAILPLEIIEEEIGSGDVLGIFRDDRKGFVAGGKVEKGKIAVGDEIKIFQGKNEKYRAKIVSLRREKSEVKECESGSECGFGLPAGANVAVGDTYVAFKTIRKERVIK
ncbi:MAG: translation initiation factor IF-2 [Patescibacteria group bacterium]